MRVILKPGGLIALVAALLLLVSLLVLRPAPTARDRTGTPSPSASSPAKTPEPKNLALPNRWQFYTEGSAVATQATLGTADVPAQPAYRITVEKLHKDPWNIGLNQKLETAAFTAGDRVVLRFWGRSRSRANILLMVQRDAPPFPHCWKQHVVLDTEWKQYSFSFKTENYQPGEALLTFKFGATLGSSEVAGISLERE